MYMQNFVWINKKIKDGGSILSMSKGDQFIILQVIVCLLVLNFTYAFNIFCKG
jgi:hypothetical protein